MVRDARWPAIAEMCYAPRMDTTHLRKRLEHSGHAIAGLLEKVPPDEASFRPTPDRWTLVEIVNHLADEEREDFRARMQSLADDPSHDWPAIDPSGWVTSRQYASRDFAESVSRWKQERGESLAWLAKTHEIDHSLTYTGARSGNPALHAGDLMLSWIAHDYFHIRQITNLRWEYLESSWPPYSPGYAGPRGEDLSNGPEDA